MVKKRGCEGFGGDNSIILDLKYKLSWYVLKSGGLDWPSEKDLKNKSRDQKSLRKALKITKS